MQLIRLIPIIKEQNVTAKYEKGALLEANPKTCSTKAALKSIGMVHQNGSVLHNEFE